MRIVIDLQGAQSGGSRNRGIGRYSLSLALAIARNRGEHEVLIALSAYYPDAVDAIREEFAGILPAENIRVWGAVGPVGMLDERNLWRTKSAEFAREAFLASLRPDIIHVSSVFEGVVDDVVTSVGGMTSQILTSVTLYDLIPYIYRDDYLGDPKIAGWYFKKLDDFKRADLWLSISESSRREGIDCLGLPEGRVVNVSADADPRFKPVVVSVEAEASLRERYGLNRDFVMYTGGYDFRKNIDGLIKAFAVLPIEVRKSHQLAIVCFVPPDDRKVLERLVKSHGLNERDVVFTGFVPNDDLVALYVLSSLFVFPSWHEGFGLPVLEAMRCGAPVIAANNSSIPEVVGWDEALFDEGSPDAMAASINKALSDREFRAELVRRGKEQANNFSWDNSAKIAVAAMEKLFSERKSYCEGSFVAGKRFRLAYICTLDQVDIANGYSQEFLFQLSRFYDVDVFVADAGILDVVGCQIKGLDCFLVNSSSYDRVIYHFVGGGASRQVVGLLEAVPGVVVLSELFAFRGAASQGSTAISADELAKDLYESHGYDAALDCAFRDDPVAAYEKYPCSLGLIQPAIGVIVHSQQVMNLAEGFYGGECVDWAVLPCMSDSARTSKSRREALDSEIDDGQAVGNRLNWQGSDLGYAEICNPYDCIDQYVAAVEGFYKWSRSDFNQLPACVAGLASPDDSELVRFSDAVALGWTSRNRKRQLLVDVSALVNIDLRSGIQRVVRSILQEWLRDPPEGYRVEPVYASVDAPGYRYARKFTFKFLGHEVDSVCDDWVDYALGDVFLGLDLHQPVVIAQKASFARMKLVGVKVKFVVYDLLPIIFPEMFWPEMTDSHESWVREVSQSDGVVCISKAVAEEFVDWLRANAPERLGKVSVDWFHLGADVDNSLPSTGLPSDSNIVISAVKNKISFLMVGTVEPRKGHAQALDAFDLLWRAGFDINLVIIGSKGWSVEGLVERIRSHKEFGSRLFWFQGASDEFLDEMYLACTCLIAASHGEGFGLSLIEAAQHGLPIIARDIPVFREVAGDHAFYFEGESGDELAKTLDGWIMAYRENGSPSSDGLRWLTWRESAGQLSSKLIGAEPPDSGGWDQVQA